MGNGPGLVSLPLKPYQSEPNHLGMYVKQKPNQTVSWILKPFKPNNLRKGKRNHLNQNHLGKSLNQVNHLSQTN